MCALPIVEVTESSFEKTKKWIIENSDDFLRLLRNEFQIPGDSIHTLFGSCYLSYEGEPNMNHIDSCVVRYHSCNEVPDYVVITVMRIKKRLE